MLRTLPLILVLTFFTASPASSQEVQYISDEIFVVLHNGPGTNYRWRARLTPGTTLKVSRISQDGKWAEVTTTRGTTGWVQKEHLTREMPAQLRLPKAEQKAEQLTASNSELKAKLSQLQNDNQVLTARLEETDLQLKSVSEELTQLKQISGRAIQLDQDNRRLVEESENLRSELGTLEAENLRLQDKLENEDFINGALAVLLGVIITLVVPRLWPKRRKSSSWA